MCNHFLSIYIYEAICIIMDVVCRHKNILLPKILQNTVNIKFLSDSS